MLGWTGYGLGGASPAVGKAFSALRSDRQKLFFIGAFRTEDLDGRLIRARL